MINRLLTLFLLVFVVFLSSCSDNKIVEPNNPSTSSADTVRNLNADTAKTGRFTFYNIRTKTVVPNSDSLTTNWDLAFMGTTILVNGGTGRVGQGGAIILTDTDFDTVSVAPETGYAVDVSPSQLAIPTGIRNGWYDYTSTTHEISPLPKRVLIIKTADGKYAKVQILSYYKDMNPVINIETGQDNSRWYTFRMVYQPDGSRTIK